MNSIQKAQTAVELLKEAILELLKEHPEGLRNVDIAELLDIHTDFQGGAKDYLSWSVLGLLLNEEKIIRKGRRYFLN